MKLFFLFLIPLSASAWQTQTGSFSEWFKQLNPKPSVTEQISFYFQHTSQQAPSNDYVKKLPLNVKNKMLSELIHSETCEDNIKIDFLKNVFTDSPHEAKKFEAGFARIASVSCLGPLNLDRVFNIFMSGDFQSRNIKGLKSNKINENTNEVCQETAIFGLGNSSYCFTQNIWHDEKRFVIHSFNEINAAQIQTPVYFREILTVLERLPNQQIRLYNLVYARGPDLNFQWVIKEEIKKQQASLISDLIQSAQ